MVRVVAGIVQRSFRAPWFYEPSLRDVGELRSKVLLHQANKLMERDTDVTQQWSDEFLEVFTPTNRAQFLANRDFLITHARQITKLLDESSSLNRRAADKYEQAARISRRDQRR